MKQILAAPFYHWQLGAANLLVVAAIVVLALIK